LTTREFDYIFDKNFVNNKAEFTLKNETGVLNVSCDLGNSNLKYVIS